MEELGKTRMERWMGLSMYLIGTRMGRRIGKKTTRKANWMGGEDTAGEGTKRERAEGVGANIPRWTTVWALY